TFGDGGGVINFNHTFTDYVFGARIEGGGSVNVYFGTTVFSADSTYSGPTTIFGGALLLDGSIASAALVESAGLLGGNGSIGGNVTNAGTVSPGASIGTLTIDGDYVGAGGTLVIESVLGDDSSPADRLVITGDASGTTTVQVINTGGLGAQTTGD